MAPISQSDTRWVKKPGKAGYVEQISTGKKVTGKIALSTTIGQGGKTINNVRGVSDYSKGRNVTKSLSGTKQTSPSAAKKTGSSSTTMNSRPAPTSTPNRGGVNTISSQSPRKPLIVPKSTSNRGGVNTVNNQSRRNAVVDKKPTVSTPSPTPSAVKPKAGSNTKPSDRFTGSKNQMAGIAGMLGKQAVGSSANQKRSVMAAIARKQSSIDMAKSRGNASAAAKKQALADAAQLANLKAQLRNMR